MIDAEKFYFLQNRISLRKEIQFFILFKIGFLWEKKQNFYQEKASERPQSRRDFQWKGATWGDEKKVPTGSKTWSHFYSAFINVSSTLNLSELTHY